MYSKTKDEVYSNFGGINTKASPYNTGVNEVLDLFNFDFTTLGSWTKRYGSTLFFGSTVQGRVTGLYEFERLSGFSQVIFAANTNLYFISGNTPTPFQTGLTNNALFSFQTFVDRLFYANGQVFQKWDGSNNTFYSLPPGIVSSSTPIGLTGSGSGFTGTYLYSYGYLNERGYAGPGIYAFTASISGHSAAIFTGLTTPTGYGITALIIYRTSGNGANLFEIGTAPVGSTQFVDTNLPLTANPLPTALWFTLAPRYLEIYNNQLFMTGFSSVPSTIYWSEVGEPEDVEPEFFFENRTNDGDVMRGIRSYNGTLLLFKERSFAQLTGTDASNFVVREVTDQYGALSNRAIVIFEQRCWFLDRKGIVEFNGANVSVVSTRIEPTFLAMNIDAARDNAVGLHNRLRNEVWFSIPVNGATLNNLTVVYDYAANAWTKFDGFMPSSLALIKSTFPTQTAMYGDYSGTIYNFGTSLMGDNGKGISCVIKTHFFRDMGQSIEKQWRRLFLNLDPVVGFTSALDVNLYANYGSVVALNRTLYQSPFQSRIDFGVSSKSLQFEIRNSTATDPIRIHGLTVESRFQRSV